MHLHNLDIEGLAAVMPNPHVEFRSKQITITPVDFTKLKMRCSAASDLEEIAEVLGNINLSAHKCPLCDMSFTEETHLKTHVSTIHPETHSANSKGMHRMWLWEDLGFSSISCSTYCCCSQDLQDLQGGLPIQC